jgi:AcrR family transcriptional regulator
MARNRSIDTTDAGRQRIMDAAEVVVRRHGPAKTNVVDVARELGQTHASVYRYFGSKAEMFDALVERWLARVSEPLEPIARGKGPAGDRLRDWLLALFRAKVRKVTADPELFSTYQAIAALSPKAVARHLAMLDEHVAAMVADGIVAGEFPPDTDTRRAARAILSGSLRFHHPALLAQAPKPPGEQEALDVFNLLIKGLKSGEAT